MKELIQSSKLSRAIKQFVLYLSTKQKQFLAKVREKKTSKAKPILPGSYQKKVFLLVK